MPGAGHARQCAFRDILYKAPEMCVLILQPHLEHISDVFFFLLF